MILESHGQLEQCIIAEHESKRKQVTDEYGIGDLAHGEGD
jgi:hypothetical protein